MNNFQIVFSVPVHEKWDVVLDLVLNFKYLNPKSAIVLHVSEGFNEKESPMKREEFERIINEIGGVFINPESVRTGYSDIIQAHLSNFRFISNRSDFHFFSMCASNELFVKPGLYEHIKDYDCGADLFDPKDRPIWVVGHYASDDVDLKRMIEESGGCKIIASHIEGSFYSKSIFKKIVDIIEHHYDYKKMKIAYPREEIYFSTILEGLRNNTTNIKVQNPGLFTFVHWAFGYNRMKISISDLKKCQAIDSQYYTVKRVDRSIDSHIRAYLRKQHGYDKTHYYSFITHKNLSYSRIFIIDIYNVITWVLSDSRNKLIGKLKNMTLNK